LGFWRTPAWRAQAIETLESAPKWFLKDGGRETMARVVMSTRVPGFDPDPAADKGERGLPPAARRALEEAQTRRAQSAPAPPRELNGRGGLDPVRYGDWEVKGLASDF
jgi:hypothetical protein